MILTCPLQLTLLPLIRKNKNNFYPKQIQRIKPGGNVKINFITVLQVVVIFL